MVSSPLIKYKERFPTFKKSIVRLHHSLTIWSFMVRFNVYFLLASPSNEPQLIEITAQPLVTKQKNRSHFYEYSPSKSSESSELLEVV
ncbi:hypothetical protein YC2023_021744 [Brassica napus]